MSENRDAMIELFQKLDNGDGQVSVHELKEGIQRELCADITDEKVTAMFMGLDMDGDNSVSLDEFLEQMCSKIDRRLAFSNKFKELDADNSGSLTLDELKPILAQLYENEGDIISMFNTCDNDGSGKVSCEEFMKSMQ